MIIEKTVKMKGSYVEAELDGKMISLTVADKKFDGTIVNIIPEIQKKIAVAKGIQIELEVLLKEIGNMPLPIESVAAVAEALSPAEVAKEIKLAHAAADQVVSEQRNSSVKFLPDNWAEVTCVGRTAGLAIAHARYLLNQTDPTMRFMHGKGATIERGKKCTGGRSYLFVCPVRKRKNKYYSKGAYRPPVAPVQETLSVPCANKA